MNYFLIYDEATGEVLGRIQTNAPQQLDAFENKVEIQQAEFELEPELFTKVNISTKVREELSAEEVAERMRVEPEVATDRLSHFMANRPESNE